MRAGVVRAPRPGRIGLAWTLGLLAVSALTGCGSNDEEPATGGGGGRQLSAGGGAIIDDCLVNQKSCANDSSGTPQCVACPQGEYANPDTKVCAKIGGTKWDHTFDTRTVEPGEEVTGQCRSWTLNNPEEIWFNAVELTQDEASHHSNWMFVPDDQFDGPDGFWPCKDRNYSQLVAALAGGVLYAQSTQATHEVQKFPDGVGIRIPPHARILSDVHILNVSPKPVTGDMNIAFYEIPKEEVKTVLTPFHLSYEELDIPPQSTSRFTGECDFSESFQSVGGTPFNMKIYYALPHTHALGSRFFFELLGGDRDGETIIDIHGFNGEARGKQYRPPIDVTGATGLRFGCEFDNPRDETVHWGFGDQEMCEVLGFAESDLAFETFVQEANPDGMDGAVPKYTGPCSTTAFPWKQDKGQ